MNHSSASMSLETQAVHAGREVLQEQGIHALPIDLSSTYPIRDLDEGGQSLEALKGIEPIHAIAAKYQVHPVQVSQWKKEAAERLPEVFARKGEAAGKEISAIARPAPRDR